MNHDLLNCTYTILKMIPAEKWLSHLIIPGVEKEGNNFLQSKNVMIKLIMQCIDIIIVFLFNSLGCGIGYGYLHRIPVRSVPEPKPVNSYAVKSDIIYKFF